MLHNSFIFFLKKYVLMPAAHCDSSLFVLAVLFQSYFAISLQTCAAINLNSICDGPNLKKFFSQSLDIGYCHRITWMDDNQQSWDIYTNAKSLSQQSSLIYVVNNIISLWSFVYIVFPAIFPPSSIRTTFWYILLIDTNTKTHISVKGIPKEFV